MRRTNPVGEVYPPDAYVFGNVDGERVASVRKAWQETCRRAGISDLHFHDLRREFACRLIETGSRDHDVRDFLGHANITATSRYLRSGLGRLSEAIDRLEAGSPESVAHKSHKQSQRTNASKDDKGEVLQEEQDKSGPRWDRTNDSLIKSQVLYH